MVLFEGIILVEELYVFGLGEKDDELVFERKIIGEEILIKFLDEFESDEKS